MTSTRNPFSAVNTINDRDRLLNQRLRISLGTSGFQMPKCICPRFFRSLEFLISRYDDSWPPPDGAFQLIGISDFAIPKCGCFLSSGSTKNRTPTSRISTTHPKWMDGSDQTSDFAKCKVKPLTYVSPGVRISDLDDHATRVLP
jgi:hypothetical protein